MVALSPIAGSVTRRAVLAGAAASVAVLPALALPASDPWVLLGREYLDLDRVASAALAADPEDEADIAGEAWARMEDIRDELATSEPTTRAGALAGAAVVRAEADNGGYLGPTFVSAVMDAVLLHCA